MGVVRILLLVLAALASLLPLFACQPAPTSCKYEKRGGHHRYRHPVGVQKIVVDAGGAGDFLSIQHAVDSVPVNNTMRVIMKINAGIYR
jgi:pectin methylesterase-like acyl-CoA thioesterase